MDQLRRNWGRRCDCTRNPSFPVHKHPCAACADIYAASTARLGVHVAASAAASRLSDTPERRGCWLTTPDAASPPAPTRALADLFARHPVMSPHAARHGAATGAFLARLCAVYADPPPLTTPAGSNLALVALASILAAAREDAADELVVLDALVRRDSSAGYEWPAPPLTRDPRLATVLHPRVLSESDLTPSAVALCVAVLLRALEEG
jgi:hypothetical protein